MSDAPPPPRAARRDRRAPAIQGRHVPAIDGLRTLSVLAVVAFHGSEDLVPGGFLGVDVFFVISGFVITLTLLREHQRTHRISLSGFYRRRWWRIMPALVAVVLLALPLVLVSGHQSVGTWAREALWGLTYTYNIGQAVTGDGGGTILNHLWSLSVEEQFYLLWAPAVTVGLAVLTTRRSRVLALTLLIVAFALGRTATALTLGDLAAFFLPWARFDEFLCGALVAVALEGRHRSARVFRSAWPALIAGIALAATMPTVHIFTDAWLFHGGYLAVAICAAIVVGHVYASVDSPITRLLSWSPLVWTGQRSYGVYLYHLPLILALFTMGAPAWLYGPLALFGSIALAAVSHRWLETPLRRRGTPPTPPTRPRPIPGG